MASIQTLEGLGRLRQCIAVRGSKQKCRKTDPKYDSRHKDEKNCKYCICSTYGPIRDSNRSFSDLCKEAELKMAIGNQLGDFGEDMDFPPLEDLGQEYGEDFFGLGEGMFTPDMLRAYGTASLAGAAGILINASILNKIEYFDDKPTAKALTNAALGIVWGRLAWMYSRDMSLGLVGAVSGGAIATLISKQLDNEHVTHHLGAAEVSNVPAYNFFSPTRGALPQLGQAAVTESDPLAVSGLADFAEAEVTADVLGSWIGG